MGMVIGKGGADVATKALVAMIEAHGGRVECSTEVTEIYPSKGRVDGVIANGNKIEASTILASLAPKHLLKMMGETSGISRYDRGLKNFRHAPGTLMVHLALDTPVPWRAKALSNFAYVHIGRSIDAAARSYEQAMSGFLPDRPLLVVGQPSAFDPSRAPEGKHCLWVQARVMPARIEGDAKCYIKSNHWGDAPAFETVTIKFVTDAASRVAEVESGNSDVTVNIPYEENDCLIAKEGLTGEAIPITDIGMMLDKNVRLAAHHAIDKQLIIDRSLKGYGVPISTLEMRSRLELIVAA